MKIYMKDGKALSYNKQFFTPKQTSETWVLNEWLGTTEVSASVEFISNGIHFISLKYEDKGGKFGHILTYGGHSGATTYVPYTEGWTSSQAFRTITFLEPPTGDLLTWLNENGVKQ